MFKIFVFLLFVLTLDLFAFCSGQPLKLSSSSASLKYVQVLTGNSPPADIWDCSYFKHTWYRYNSPSYPSTNGVVSTVSNGAFYDRVYEGYDRVSVCPVGQSPDSNNVCSEPPPPQTCSWAIPPYQSVAVVESMCKSTTPPVSNFDDINYFWHLQYCLYDKTCYGKEYKCPTGYTFSATKQKCVVPLPPSPDFCPGGQYYQRAKSVEINGELICGIDFICKSNNKVIKTETVSCGAGPVVPPPAGDTSGDAPEPHVAPSPNPYKDGTSACKAKTDLARIMCTPPNIFSSSCDPITGNMTSQSCTPPTVAPTKDIAPSDTTKGATSEDIKNLSNDLSKNIKTSLQDFFTDGGTPYLSSIKGTLEASTILQADTNDKLDQINGNGEASLILQSDTNTKLDAVKGSVDNVDGSLATVKNYLSGGTGLSDSDMLQASDLLPDGAVKSTIEGLGSDVASIKTQFDDLKAVVTGDFVPPSFAQGSCTPFTASFHGNTITANPQVIANIISPYAPVTSMMVYIILMIMTFRSVFKFFSRGI